jgi:hypothetical protein
MNVQLRPTSGVGPDRCGPAGELNIITANDASVRAGNQS